MQLGIKKYNPINLLPKIIPPSMVPTINRRPLRIAVSGLSGAGKTAFLTSLIEHLKEHDPKQFQLSNSAAVITAVPAARRGGSSWPEFPLEQNFAGFTQRGSWPAKTTDCSSYTLNVEANHWWVSGCQLTLYDVPGERFADSAMMQKNFTEWSDYQIKWLGTVTQVCNGHSVAVRRASELKSVDEYLRLMRRPGEHDSTETFVICAYKNALGDLVRNYHSYTSPSYFLLDQQGKAVWDNLGQAGAMGMPEDWDRVVAARTSGLSGEEFAPLTPQVAAKHPEMAKCFEQRYDNYRASIVEPIFKELASCHSMVVLLDIADILAGGPPQLWDADHFITQVLDAVRPGGKLSQAVLAKFGLANHMRRIALVAAQCDRFHTDDYDNLRKLVEKLVKTQLDKIAGLTHKCFYCAAVRSTSSDDNGRLRGYLYRDGEGIPHEESTYKVDRIPPEWFEGEFENGWPNQWDINTVNNIQRVWPKLPRVHKALPEHIQLDEVFRFVTRW